MLEGAGLGDAVDLQILDTVIAGRLWLPFSLIEIAFRNAADRAITAAHPSGENWLLASGRANDRSLIATDVAAPPALCGTRYDGTQDDPIADAARMASSQLGRDQISRDDLIAHLLLGFWVNRCPEALSRDAGLPVWDLIAATQEAPLHEGMQLRRRMTRLLRTRNRVAHHEPLLFRAKHVFSRAGDAKTGADLVTSLLGALPPFLKDVETIVETAATMAPMAAKYLAPLPDHIRNDIAPFEARLASERRLLREAREARLAAQRAALAARQHRTN